MVVHCLSFFLSSFFLFQICLEVATGENMELTPIGLGATSKQVTSTVSVKGTGATTICLHLCQNRTEKAKKKPVSGGFRRCTMNHMREGGFIPKTPCMGVMPGSILNQKHKETYTTFVTETERQPVAIRRKKPREINTDLPQPQDTPSQKPGNIMIKIRTH